MSLLPPPPAPQQQRRPVRGSTTSAAAAPRGLYSDAVGLRTGMSADALRHPTASVGLHDGPKFAPQHRAVAQHAPLDIGAMVAARLSLPEPEMDTAGDKKFMFNYGKKKKGEDSPAKEGPGVLERAASSVKDLAKKGVDSVDAQWAAANKEDAITGMDKYDYTFIASKDSLQASMVMSMKSKAMIKFGSRDKEDVTVKFGPDHPRSAMFPEMLKAGTSGSIALLATIDKTWDAKEEAFQIQSAQDKIKTFDAGDTYRIPPAKGDNSFLVTGLRDHWAKTVDGIVDTKNLLDYPKKVAALQDEAKMHVERVDSSDVGKKDDVWVAGSPHPLSMGQAAMVAMKDAHPAHLDAFVGAGFLAHLQQKYMEAGRNKRANDNEQPEVRNPDNNTPFIIPIGSMYKDGSAAYKTLKAADLKPDDDLRCVNALLVVKIPTGTNPRLKEAFGLKDDEKINVEWSRIAPHQEAPVFTGPNEKVVTDSFKDKYHTVANAARMNELLAEKEQRKKENDLAKNQKLSDEKQGELNELLDEAMKAYNADNKATWTETVIGFEQKNKIAIYGLHLDYRCFQKPEMTLDDCKGDGLLISKHPLFIRPFGGSDVEPAEAPSPKDLMRIWTIGDGNKLVNALPLALKGQGFDCRFLWAALKLAQRSFRTAQGKAKPGAKQVLNMKGGKVTTATRAKHRWLNGLQAVELKKGMTGAPFEGDYDDVFVGCCFSDDEEE